MLRELLVLCCALLVRCQEQQEVRPTDCAFSVWTDWQDAGDGLRDIRTRFVSRQPQFGGIPCSGPTFEFRNKSDAVQPQTFSVDKFLTKFIPGDVDTLPLGSHLLRRGEVPLRYTKSRDLAVVIDTTIFNVAIPQYTSAISSLVGAICGYIGNQPQDNIVSVITYDHTGATVLHTFNAEQTKAAIQAKIVSITSTASRGQVSDISSALHTAKEQINTFGSGTRAYNLANKDVLLFVTYRTVCTAQEIARAYALKAAGRVYVVVLGQPVDGSSPPADWCLQQYASDQLDFHLLRLVDLRDLQNLIGWLVEIASPVNSCPPPSPNAL